MCFVIKNVNCMDGDEIDQFFAGVNSRDCAFDFWACFLNTHLFEINNKTKLLKVQSKVAYYMCTVHECDGLIVLEVFFSLA